MTDRVGQQFGNYRLLRVLGQGTFAEVYLGEHRYLEMPAAIKVLHVQMGPDTHESFRHEALTHAHLQHPHIVHIYDFGFQDQTPYLAMEYIPNGTLRSFHPKGVQISLEQIILYVKQIASALDYAHGQHVIHRDVKPENILLGANHKIALSDFGIAVVQHQLSSLSMHNTAGTPVYMAPEQIQHKPCKASDQYALGVIVYEWLCGDPPFHGSLFEVWSQHLHKPPPSLRAHLPQLPPAVETAVFRALAKDPGQRFASIADFTAVLEEAFFATQPLPLRGLHSHLPQDQATLPLTRSTGSSVPSQSKPDSSNYATQPRIEPEQELASSSSAQRAMQRQSVPKQAKHSVTLTNRRRLLRRVRSFWITGMLEQSLHGVALMELGLQSQPDAVANPWPLVLHQLQARPHLLPTGTRITEVYDRAEGELLILGAPGSGKTTLLLELTRELLDRAEHDEHHPIPIVFTLSTWATKPLPLIDWLIEELNSKYQVPCKLGCTLVETDQVLPLLDGLDEVMPEKRTACIEAINTYRQEHGLLPLVVCSRNADYLAQTVRIQLESAVMVQPLSDRQVDAYLASGGEPLRALQVALDHDTSLRELTHTPLMLSLLILTYQNMLVENLVRVTPPLAQRRQVFEQYVQRMLVRQGVISHSTPAQMLHWLHSLAKQLCRQQQTIFSVEDLQPDWLSDSLQRLYWWSARLVGGLLSGLVVGLVTGLVGGLIDGLVFGLVGGLLCMRVIGRGGRIRPAEVVIWLWEGVGMELRVGLVGGLVLGLFVGLLIGLFGGLFLGLANGLVFGLFTGLALGLGGLVFGLVFGLVCVLIVGLFGRLSPYQLTQRALLSPNEGIRRSGKNGLIFGLVFGLIGGLASGLIFGLIFGLGGGLAGGLLVGLGVGLGAGLTSGLAAFIQHFVLRFWLRRTNCLPWNVVSLLDEAAERLLLRKVGGSYMFAHRLLFEYFIALEEPVSTIITSADKR